MTFRDLKKVIDSIGDKDLDDDLVVIYAIGNAHHKELSFDNGKAEVDKDQYGTVLVLNEIV